jgi:hypothetical protein
MNTGSARHAGTPCQINAGGSRVMHTIAVQASALADGRKLRNFNLIHPGVFFVAFKPVKYTHA